MRYDGYYESMPTAFVSRDPAMVRQHIWIAMQEQSIGASTPFVNYETAYIKEINFIGRHVAQHYFSIENGGCWKRHKISITFYSSWRDAIEPLRSIAQWILKVLGYKGTHEKFESDLIEEIKNLSK